MRRDMTQTGAHLFVYNSLADVLGETDGANFKPKDEYFVGESLPTWESVKERINKLWPDGIATVQKFVEQLSQVAMPPIASHVRRVRYNSDDGDEVDLDRLRAGQQDFWRKSEREEKIGPTEVTIITDLSAHGFRRSDELIWRGAVAIAMTYILEQLGYRVELWVTSGTIPNKTTPTWVKLVGAYCLKRTSDPLDVGSVINGVAAWFYRTVEFTMVRTQAKLVGTYVNDVEGYPYTPTPSDLDSVSRDRNRIYSSGVFSFHDAVAMMEAELKKIGEHHE